MTDLHDLPPTWKRVRLDQIAEVRLGRQRSPKNHVGPNMRPYLRAANVTWSGLALDDVKEMHFSESEEDAYFLRFGDILLSEASGSRNEVGKPAVWKEEISNCCFQNTLIRVRLHIGSPRFMLHLFTYEALRGALAGAARGVGIHHLGATTLAAWSVPFPPTTEQERIVAAIEEHFSHVDAGVIALKRARRNLKRMRAAALLAAVEGRLVPQDTLGLSGEKMLSDAGVATVVGPRELPKGWAWCRLGDIAVVGSGATPKKDRSDYYEGGSIPWVTSTKLNDEFVREPTAYITDRAVAETAVKMWPRHALLVAMYGEGRTRGKCSELLFDSTTNQACAAIVLRQELDFYRPFLKLFLNASYEVNRRLASGGVQPNLGLGIIRDFVVPFPPVGEQVGIVEAIDRLSTLLVATARQIDVTARQAESLRRATLKHAFEGCLVPQDPREEPASILLERTTDVEASASNGRPVSRRAK